MMNEAGADILFVGHSHKPYHWIIQTAEGNYRIELIPALLANQKMEILGDVMYSLQ